MSEKQNKDWLHSQFNDPTADSALIEEWLLGHASDPEQDDVLMELLDKSEYYDPAMSSKGWMEFNSRLNEVRREQRKCKVHKAFRWFERVAAVLILPVGALALVMFMNGSLRDVKWLEANTATGETMSIVMPDGSDITLGPSTKIVYPTEFGSKERQVFVTGSIHADIEHNPKVPFVVSSGDLAVRVYGTEFQMNSYDSDTEVDVALIDGSVHMLNKTDGRKVVLRPGDIVSFDKLTGSFIRKNFAAGYYHDIVREGGFQFVNQRLCDIVSCLERHFGVSVIIDDDSIKDERYFASFINNESIDEILAALNAQDYLNISRSGNTIRISPKK